MTLNTSDETMAELQRQADSLLDDAAFAGNAAQDADDERVTANLLSAKAKFLGIRATVLQALHRIQTDREAKGDADDDPEAVEAKALEFLRSRGWRCDRVDIVPVVIRALEGHPEAKEAVLAALPGVKL